MIAHCVWWRSTGLSRRVVIALAALMLSCTGCVAAIPCTSDYMTYKYPGKNHFGYRFRGGEWWRINIGGGPDNGGAERNSISPTPPLNRVESIVGCSTSKYLCVETYRWVFAIPKGKLSPGASYDIAGAHIQLEACLRQTSAGCVIILAISDCRSHVGGKRLSPGEIVANDCRASGWGQRVVYIFDQGRGVIAFEESDDWVPRPDDKVWDLSALGKTAAMLALVENRGLLSCALRVRDPR